MPTVNPFPVEGRDEELAQLRAAVAATRTGAGGCLVLTGPPGIGKTRLLVEVAAHAAEVGLAVAHGSASELDRVAPLRTLLGTFAGVIRPGIELEPPRERLWYIEKLGEALEAYVAEHPLLAIIDDAQWTDEFSALALRVLVPALSSSPVRWLLARRPVPAPSAAQDTIDWLVAGGAPEVHLARLDDEAIGRLCVNVLHTTPDASVLELAVRSQGNPFLLEQLLSALRETGQIVVSGGIATVVGDELPSSFLAAVEQRLRGLAPSTLQLLQAGSVFGRPFTVHAAAQLLGQRATDLLPAAAEAIAAGILAGTETELTFAHDLLRQAIYNQLRGPVRAAMHREAAEVVRAEGGTVVEIAEHLTHTGRAGDREAVAVLRDAAHEVAGRAPATAADYIVRALDRLGEDDDERPGLTADAVRLLASAGQLVKARDLGEAALRGGLNPATEATVLLGLAESLKHAGQNRLAVEYARRAMARPAVPDPILARLHAIAAHGLLYIDDLEGADRAGAEADRLGTASDTHGASVFGTTARTVVARAQGRLDDALRYARYAVDTADRVGGEAIHMHPRIWLGAALAAVDRFAEADATYTAGRAEAERLGTAWSQPLWHFYHASLLVMQGRLDDATAEADAGLHIAEQLTALQLSVPLLGLLTRVAVIRAQLPLAYNHMRRMRRLLDDGITAAPEDVTWAIGVLQAADGQPQVALNTLTDLYDQLPQRMLLLANDPGSAPDLVRLALEAGDPARAEAAVTAAKILASRDPITASLTGAALHAQGLLAGDRELLRQAAEQFGRSPRPLARASALEDAGAAEHAAGNRSEAVELLEAARDDYAACGAQRGVARVEQRLRTSGVSRRPGPARPKPSPTPGGLTRAEEAVARLVADGKRNREVAELLFISRHTVDSHLRHIFAKLGINSRVELARWFRESPRDGAT